MKKEDFLVMIDKYLSGKATLEEEIILIDFFDSFQEKENTGKDIKNITLDGIENRVYERILLGIRK
ncbi:hypothetical protein AB6735_22120 [Mucilaginibacter sp. RCC_168]|uniref:hypothetical protein n=1 Tax=Mucilaginibacter sp. RCC_168 TaxID=3239221 RepID=UPI003524A464